VFLNNLMIPASYDGNICIKYFLKSPYPFFNTVSKKFMCQKSFKTFKMMHSFDDSKVNKIEILKEKNLLCEKLSSPFYRDRN
jgi:hypothetical protein